MEKPRPMWRGDVVLVDLSAKADAPIRKTRPAVIVQNDSGNRYSPQVIVAAVRHDPKKGLPVHVCVPKGIAGLTKDSVVDCGILSTVLKTNVGPRIGRLPAAYLRQVEEALRVSLP